ncbi:MAG: hypothetical protein ACI8Q1_001725, partial [Parvicella sp.]
SRLRLKYTHKASPAIGKDQQKDKSQYRKSN